MKKVAIIGAGALGIVTAIMLKDNFEVTLIEKNNKIGKKILASGNGKCNFTNVSDIEGKYNNEYATNIVKSFDSSKTLEFFTKLGLVYKIDEENRVYPLSESSATVLDVLKCHLKGVKILLDSKVKQIKSLDNGVEICYSNNQEIYDYVVCASGSIASNLGSEAAYDYLKDYGVQISDLKSSLSSLFIKENLSEISGVRARCLVTLYKENNPIYKESGEVLFKDDSLSGIVIFNISSIMNREKGNYSVGINLVSDAINYNSSIDLRGVLHPKMYQYVLKNNIKDITDLKFNVIKSAKFENAQVISGGVKIEELNNDLSLKQDKRIYLGGEVIDCDGMCGGYNLQFAFSCAYVISESIKKINQ